MNRLGFLHIPLIVWLVLAGGVVGATYKLGGFGGASSGEQCDLLNPLGKPCLTGLECKSIGLVNSVCVPKTGFGGWFERFLYSLSLDNIVCGSSGLLAPFCKIALPLLALLVGGIVLGLGGWIVAGGNPLGLYLGAGIGIVLGLGFSSFVSFYWWVLLIIALVLGVVYFMLKGGR